MCSFFKRTKSQRYSWTMRITAAAVLVLLATTSTTTVHQNEGHGPLSLAILPAVSAYVPNNARRPGYGAAASSSSASSAPSPKQNSNGDASSSVSSSAVYYRNTADVYESTDAAAYETVQERIQRVRSGHMSEAEKRAYLKSALGGTGNSLDRITPTTTSSSTGSTTKASDAATDNKAWSHPSYTPPRYITGPLGKDAESADSKRRYLESVMDPNRFQSFGSVGRANSSGGKDGTTVAADGMSADEAELAAVQAKIARIEEEKKRIAAEAKEKADIEAARHKLQEQQRAEKEREATTRLDLEKATLAEKEREAIEKATLAERLTAAAREASNKLGKETASLAERLAAAAEEAEIKKQQEKRDQEEQDRILRAERERLLEAEKKERIELARAAEEHFREQERIEQDRIAAEKKAQEEARLEQERIAAEEARIEEEQRLEHGRIAAEEKAAAAEEARLAEEKAVAEEAQQRAKLEEERLEQERLATEEAAARAAEEARLAEEQVQAEAERLERERIEAEKEAYIERLEVQRFAEEQQRIEAARIRDDELQAIADAQRLEQERIEAEWYASQEEEQALVFDYVADEFEHVDFGAPAFAYGGEESYFVPKTMEDINIMTYSIVEAMRPLINPPAQLETDVAVEQHQSFQVPNAAEAYVSEDEYAISDGVEDFNAPVDASNIFVDDLSGSVPTFPPEAFSIEEGEHTPQEPMQFFDDAAPLEQIEHTSFETENTLLVQDDTEEDQVETEAGKPFLSLRERFEINQVKMQRLAEEQAAAEEEARIQAEKAELERIESERLAAEKAEQERVEAERLAAEKAKQERIEAERRLAAKRLQAVRMVVQVAENAKTTRMNDRSKMRSVPDPGFFGNPQGNSLFQIPSENALDEGLDLGKEVAEVLKLADDALAHANDADLQAERLHPKEQVKRIVQTATGTTSKVAMVAVKGSLFLGGAATIGALQLGASATKKVWRSVISKSKVWDRSSLTPTSVEDFDVERAQVEIGDALRRAKKAWIAKYGGKPWY